jgi:hypothetical protein
MPTSSSSRNTAINTNANANAIEDDINMSRQAILQATAMELNMSGIEMQDFIREIQQAEVSSSFPADRSVMVCGRLYPELTVKETR